MVKGFFYKIPTCNISGLYTYFHYTYMYVMYVYLCTTTCTPVKILFDVYVFNCGGHFQPDCKE